MTERGNERTALLETQVANNFVHLGARMHADSFGGRVDLLLHHSTATSVCNGRDGMIRDQGVV